MTRISRVAGAFSLTVWGMLSAMCSSDKADLDAGSYSDADADGDSNGDADSDADADRESWYAQLDDNIKSRTVWLLDKAIKGEGHINLCIRWGATSAPSSDVKANMASTVERWLNDWFTALGDYGCFPYPDGVGTDDHTF